MKKFALIGKDIDSSFSPAIHRYCFKKLSLNAKYDVINILKKEDLLEIANKLKQGELNGVNVTAPYKKDFIRYIDTINPRASKIGSINCAHINKGLVIGNNTDWYGFVKCLDNLEFYRDVIIFGSGGVVSALIYPFMQKNQNTIHVIGRSLEKLKIFKSQNISIHSIENFNLKVTNSLIINTIPNNSSIDWKMVLNNINGKILSALDLNYYFKVTKFLNCFNSDVKIKNGLDMLVHQALMSIDIWYGGNLSASIDMINLKNRLMEEYY